MKKIIIFFGLILLFNDPVFCIDKELLKFTSIKEILNNMTAKYESIKSYKANFGIKTVIDNVEKGSSGEIKYQYPDRFIMLYNFPKDQFIYGDEKVMKIYIPHLNVLGVQDLEHYRPGLFISGKSALSFLKSKYNFSFYKSNKPVLVGDMFYYVLLLEQKDVSAGFKDIIIYVSPYWLIVKAEATTLNGNKVKISFSNIRLNTKITDNEFEFTLPVNTQTVKNPLLFKLEGE